MAQHIHVHLHRTKDIKLRSTPEQDIQKLRKAIAEQKEQIRKYNKGKPLLDELEKALKLALAESNNARDADPSTVKYRGWEIIKSGNKWYGKRISGSERTTGAYPSIAEVKLAIQFIEGWKE